MDSVERTIRVGIFLVHDRALLASAIGVALGQDPELDVVIVENNPAVGPVRVLGVAPDVVLVDSTALAAQLSEEAPELRLIILGASSDPGITLASIRAGASACVGENTSSVELASVIRRVHAGEVVYEPGVLLMLLQRSNLSLAAIPRRTATLSGRELEVLSVIATGSSSLETARYLGISLNTVRTHLKNILVKLDARSKLEAVIIALREGRIQLPPD